MSQICTDTHTTLPDRMVDCYNPLVQGFLRESESINRPAIDQNYEYAYNSDG